MSVISPELPKMIVEQLQHFTPEQIQAISAMFTGGILTFSSWAKEK